MNTQPDAKFNDAGTTLVDPAQKSYPHITLHDPKPAMSPRFRRVALEISGVASAAIGMGYYFGMEGAGAVMAFYISGRSACAFLGLGELGQAVSKHLEIAFGVSGSHLYQAVMFSMLTGMSSVVGFTFLAESTTYSPVSEARSISINNAAYKIYERSANGSACTPYHEQLSWGRQGKIVGEVCVSIDLIRRDGDCFFGTVTPKGEKPFTQTFRPEGSMAPGYQNAFVIKPPS